MSGHDRSRGQRYRALLETEIESTVDDPVEIDAELRELASMLRS